MIPLLFLLYSISFLLVLFATRFDASLLLEPTKQKSLSFHTTMRSSDNPRCFCFALFYYILVVVIPPRSCSSYY